jgi:hypothetical protein
MDLPRDDEACGFNPWFEYLREVKAQARRRLVAGEDPTAIRRGFRDRIGEGEGERPGPILGRLREVANLALDAVLPPDDRPAVAGSVGRQRPRHAGFVFGRRPFRR